MMDFIKQHKSILIFGFLMLFFLLLRIPGINTPYHQDEWKNVSASETMADAGGFFAHPPLMQMLFVVSNNILGGDYMRVFPLFFYILSVYLLYLVVRQRFGPLTATWTVFLYVTSFYGFLGSLVPDVDGSVLPFLFVSALYAYDRITDEKNEKRGIWAVIFAGILLIGLLTKLSFIIVIGVFVLDYLWARRKELDKKKILMGIVGIAAFGASYVLILTLIDFVYPAFDMSIMLGHANQFNEDGGRNWIQIIVQGTKAVYYLSPLLLVPLLFIDKEVLKRTRIFSIYLMLGFVFYFVVFDFSRGALDKYLMFSLIPLSVIVGSILSRIKLDLHSYKKRLLVLLTLVVVSLLVFINFLSHDVVPLYPKEAWFGRVLHADWLILNPFNGGSGPLGFYVSFFFIAVCFLLSLSLALITVVKKQWRGICVIAIILVGTTYNIVFMEEFLWGRINGSAEKVLNESVNFIAHNNDVSSVLTYNDIGAYELTRIEKYGGRFYAAPQFEESHKQRFAEHVEGDGGYFLVVDVPHINESSFYGEYFKACEPLFEAIDGKISSNVYSCTQ